MSTSVKGKLTPAELVRTLNLYSLLIRGRIGSVLLLILALIAGCQGNSGDRIIICSKNFTEQLILGELLAQKIEADTDLTVERRFNLAGELCHQALVAGQVDLYVEYTGTAFTNILKYPPISDPKKVYNTIQSDYQKKYQLEWMPPLGFNNTFAIVVRGEDAKKFKLKTISDAVPHTPKWQVGFGYEFSEREDGFPGLVKTYQLKFAGSPKTMDLGLIYRALQEQQVDLVAGNSTDALIDVLGFVVLEDNKQYFPPYQAAPVVRQQALKEHPQLRQTLESLSNTISEETMRKLNYEVDGKKRDVSEVVQDFLVP